jgi:DNA end-binding protein Ku
MPATTWKGIISFGLVSVPVQLYAATESHSGPQLHQVHKTDGSRIKLRRFCEDEDLEVPYKDIAKGYESPDGREVIITDDDVKDLPVPSKKVIDVLAFVDQDSIDPLRFSSPYYVGVADKTPSKPYILLREAMRESGKLAVTKVTMRTRESLAVLRVMGDQLVLQTMLWPDEIRTAEGLAPTDQGDVRPQEIAMARSLMDIQSEGFDLDSLQDEYDVALQALIDARLEGVEPPHGEEAPTGGGKVLDLMAALQASVEDAKRHRGETGAGSTEEPATQPAKKTTAKRPAAAKTAPKDTAARKSTAKTSADKPAAKKTTAKKSSRRAS